MYSCCTPRARVYSLMYNTVRNCTVFYGTQLQYLKVHPIRASCPYPPLSVKQKNGIVERKTETEKSRIKKIAKRGGKLDGEKTGAKIEERKQTK